MKNDANKLTKESLEGKINELFLDLKSKINVLKELNYNEVFPESNVNEILPQLKIDKGGFASFDIDEILDGFDVNPESYEEDEFSKIDERFFKSNKNFDINEILTTMNSLKRADNVDLEEQLNILNTNDLGKKNGFNLLDDDSSMLPDLGSIEKFKTKNATLTVDMNG